MEHRPLRIVFAGTPQFAADHLAALLAAGHQIVGVLTQPDRPAGRGQKLTPSPVKVLAEQHSLPLAQPLRLTTPEAQQQLAEWQPELLVVVAYGLLLPPAVLEMPRLGCINVHGSLLPRWRGAAPIQRAIEAGDSESGVTIMQMDEGLDTGAMLLKRSCPIHADDTSQTLFERLAALGPQALLEALPLLAAGQLPAEAQDHSLATYAHKLSKEEALLDWRQPATVLERRIRAFHPWPGARMALNAEAIKIASAQLATGQGAAGTVLNISAKGLEVACGDGSLLFNQLQRAGKPPQRLADILNGNANLFHAGQQLSTPDHA